MRKLILQIIFIEIMLFFLLFSLYGVMQQSIRGSAYIAPERQLSLVESALNNNQAISQILPAHPVDLSVDHSVFIIFADENHTITGAGASINGQDVVPPAGVLENAEVKGINKISWQPSPNIREAIVVKYINSSGYGGYVVAGQSLIEYEALISRIGLIVLILFGVGTILNIGGLLLYRKLTSPKRLLAD